MNATPPRMDLRHLRPQAERVIFAECSDYPLFSRLIPLLSQVFYAVFIAKLTFVPAFLLMPALLCKS